MKTDYLKKLILDYPSLSAVEGDIDNALELLDDCVANGKKILTCGNGGSAADAEHIVGELLKGFHLKRQLPASETADFLKFYPDEGDYLAENLQQAIPAVSLVASISFLTAFLNDMDPGFIFAQQVYALGRPGDVLIAISTSGNSKNVVLAAKTARVRGVKVLSLTGQSGGVLDQISDVTIKAPAVEVAKIQELHLPIYHCICSMLEQKFFAA